MIMMLMIMMMMCELVYTFLKLDFHLLRLISALTFVQALCCVRIYCKN